MKIPSKTLSAIVLLSLLAQPTFAVANELTQKPTNPTAAEKSIRQTETVEGSKSVIRVLSDHPGSATALTPRQKTEIKQVLAKAKGNKSFTCTAASLDGQRESMYPVVLRRAELVCEYAKSLNPNIQVVVQEKRTKAGKFNGRVVVVSK